MQEATLDSQSASPVFGKQESRYRLIVDDFLSPDECSRLVEFITDHGVVGDGYGGNPHPHTPNETFGGYTIDGRFGDASQPGHLLALEVANRARLRLKQHYRLPFLWLEYGQLVQREATGSGAEAEAEEYSHPWHFDNQADHVRHRTHTAIIYLNDGFEGGKTRFKESENVGPFREVTPKAGKLVSFSVAENAHAVSKLKSGKRYVYNMWFSTHWTRFRNNRRIFKPL